MCINPQLKIVPNKCTVLLFDKCLLKTTFGKLSLEKKSVLKGPAGLVNREETSESTDSIFMLKKKD